MTRHLLQAERRALGPFVLVAALLACLPGCASRAGRIRQAREAFYAGDVASAAESLQAQLERDDSDRDVVALDLATVQLVEGQPQAAEASLRQVRDRFDYLEQKDLTETALSYLTDDTHRAYAGEDYEKVMVRVMLAVANLMSDGSDALAYSLQANTKQQEIIEAGIDLGEENPKAAYKRVALGAYLHGMLREVSHTHYDDAERWFATAVSWNPDCQVGQQELERARSGRHSAPGNGVMYVFALVGRGPYKREASEVPSSQALLIADQILSATGKHTLPPTIAPIKVPQVVVHENEVDGVAVSLDGRRVGETETVTDVGQLAVQQQMALYDHIVARAVARRVVKKAAVYALKGQLEVSNQSWANLALDAAGVVWEATESADLRCWSLLPNSVQVLRLELPVGEHHVSLQSSNAQRTLGVASDLTVPIEDGRNTYVLACYPGPKLTGVVQVSCP